MVMFQVPVDCPPDTLSFLFKIKPCPDTDGAEDGILGVKLAEDLIIISRFRAVNGRLGVIRLDLFVFIPRDLFFCQRFSQTLTAGPLGILDLIAPEDLIRQVSGAFKCLSENPLFYLNT